MEISLYGNFSHCIANFHEICQPLTYCTLVQHFTVFPSFLLHTNVFFPLIYILQLPTELSFKCQWKPFLTNMPKPAPLTTFPRDWLSCLSVSLNSMNDLAPCSQLLILYPCRSLSLIFSSLFFLSPNNIFYGYF